MDPARFAELPIEAGNGRGAARLGASLRELIDALGQPTATRTYGETSYPEWHALGLHVWLDRSNDRVIALTFACRDPEMPRMAPIPGTTDRGVTFGAAERIVIDAYGPPRGSYRGEAGEQPQWVRLVYHGVSFRLVDDAVVSIVVEPLPAITARTFTRNRDLEAAIIANPDDPAPYLVYADWLQQQGEPLGRWIVEHARGGDDFIKTTEDELLGPLAPYKDMLPHRVWRNGVLHKLKIANAFERSTDHGGELPEFAIEDLLEVVLDGDIGSFVVDLTVGIATFIDNDYYGVMTTIGARPRPMLRSLFIGDFRSEETELNWSGLGDASTFYAATPNLRELVLRSGNRITLGAIELPELRSFATLTGGLTKPAIESMVTARWPKLERLSLQIGSRRYGSDIAVEDLQPILDGAGLPLPLRHLGLTNFEHTNELVPLVARSNILPRLRSLDLSLGSLGPEGIEPLLAAAAAFAHLDRLDLSSSWLDPNTANRVRERLPNAVVASQRFDARYPTDRYIAAGE